MKKKSACVKMLLNLLSESELSAYFLTALNENLNYHKYANKKTFVA